ncbi:MAG: hypothetical protein KAI25_00310 [Hyphomicrobiaceae bacterium]|nr:hypothetical protein [Hyphomicrobiaceae bacterium]
MAEKTNPFDCVEMKNRIQADILAEYETRKSEFPSFAAFLAATESDWEKDFRAKLQQKAIS